MKNLTNVATSVLLAVTAFVAGSNVNSNPSPIPQGPIATVDMEKVINDFAEDGVLFENLKNEKKQKDQALDALKDQVEAMMQNLAIMRQGSKEYIELQKQIELEKQRGNLDDRANRVWYTSRKGEIVREVYKKAVGVIEAYAREKGIIGVFLSTKPELPAGSYEDVSNAIIVRSLIWSTETIDITNDIQKLMKR